MLIAVIAAALLYGLLNGLHDASNAIASLVATRAARPGPAVAMAAGCHLVGPLLLGTAVADTVGGIIRVEPDQLLAVTGAAASAAVVWGLVTWWWGLPTSSSHALVGGLAGAAWSTGGLHAVRWGGMSGLRPSGVAGVLIWLAVSPAAGLVLAFAASRAARRGLQRASTAIAGPLRVGEWLTSAALALGHGANDAQKTMGLVALALLASGHLSQFAVPLWVRLAAAAVLTVGTSFGGWRIVRTLGRDIFRMRPLDALVSQATSAAIVFGAAAAGAPVSTTDVVAPAVVGVGAAQRARRVRWRVARHIAVSWVLTLPASAALGAVAVPVWRSL